MSSHFILIVFMGKTAFSFVGGVDNTYRNNLYFIRLDFNVNFCQF